MLFDGQRTISVELPEGTTMEGMIDHLRRHHLREKEELFV